MNIWARVTTSGLSILLATAANAAAVGTPLTSELSLTTVTPYALSSSVRTDASGNFTVLWVPSQSLNAQPLAFQRFAADGTPLTSIVPLDVSTEFRAGSPPAMGLDTAGNLAFAWDCSVAGTYTGSVCTQTFNADGSARSAVVVVDPGVAPGSKTQGSAVYHVDLIINPNGTYTVGWSSATFNGKNAPASPIDAYTVGYIKTRVYDWSAAAQANAKTAFSKTIFLSESNPVLNARVIGSSSGTYVATWNASQYVTKGKFFSAAGKATSGIIQLFNATPGTDGAEMTHLTQALLSSGELISVYDQGLPASDGPQTHTLYLATCIAPCKTAGTPIAVGTRAATTSANSGNLQLAFAASGNGFVTWGDPSTDVVSSVAVSSSNAISPAFTVGSNPIGALPAPGDANLSTTMNPAGNLVAVWGSLVGRIFQGQ